MSQGKFEERNIKFTVWKFEIPNIKFGLSLFGHSLICSSANWHNRVAMGAIHILGWWKISTTLNRAGMLNVGIFTGNFRSVIYFHVP